jgi:hypothetical protein
MFADVSEVFNTSIIRTSALLKEAVSTVIFILAAVRT